MLNNGQITKKEVKGSVKEMKAGKATGIDRCSVECLESSGLSVIE